MHTYIWQRVHSRNYNVVFLTRPVQFHRCKKAPRNDMLFYNVVKIYVVIFVTLCFFSIPPFFTTCLGTKPMTLWKMICFLKITTFKKSQRPKHAKITTSEHNVVIFGKRNVVIFGYVVIFKITTYQGNTTL